jgi:hypothetical protein
MRDDIDLENRLRRLPTDLMLSPADQAALARLHRGPDASRKRRRWLRGAAITVAFAAVLAAGAVAFATSSALSVVLRFHPVGWLPGSGPVSAGPPCPPPQPIALADLQRRVGFRVLTAGGATLVSSRYGAPCRGAEAFVELVYEEDGESFVLRESSAPVGPVQVNLKDYAKSSWRIVTVNGNEYAVQVLDGSVTVAAFKRDGTRVDVTVGAKGSSDRPMSLGQFEELVRNIN